MSGGNGVMSWNREGPRGFRAKQNAGMEKLSKIMDIDQGINIRIIQGITEKSKS